MHSDDDVLPIGVPMLRRDHLRLWLRRKWYDVRMAAQDMWERIVW